MAQTQVWLGKEQYCEMLLHQSSPGQNIIDCMTHRSKHSPVYNDAIPQQLLRYFRMCCSGKALHREAATNNLLAIVSLSWNLPFYPYPVFEDILPLYHLSPVNPRYFPGISPVKLAVTILPALTPTSGNLPVLPGNG